MPMLLTNIKKYDIINIEIREGVFGVASRNLPFKDFEDKIHVMLYGGKGSRIFKAKDSKETAEVICCDHCNECSFYQAGTCLRTGGYFANNICKFGMKECFEGYTPAAKAFTAWHEHFRNDDKYGALQYPRARFFGVIGEYYMFEMTYVGIESYDKALQSSNGFLSRRECENAAFEMDGEKFSFVTDTHKRIFFKKENMTPELLHKLFSFTPRTIFESAEIKDHKSVDVPFALWMMKQKAPELYASLVAEYPEYQDKMPDFKGKSAKVKTLKPGSVLYDCHGNGFVLSEDRTVLTCDSFGTLLPFGAKTSVVTIPVTDDMVAEIPDNDCVTENTVFA